MRHSLAQLLAASSGQVKSGEPVAACSFPSPGAEQRPEEETEAATAMAEDSLEEPDEGELLFPAGLELDAWLEAAVSGEASPPAWGRASPSAEAARPLSSSRTTRPGSNRLKAAAAARLNRQKKKLYVQGLETRLQGLAAENRQLRDRNRGLCRRLRDLERETGYLRAVLANQSTLGRLLGRLAGDGAGSLGLRMRISTSLFQPTAAGAFGENGDHDYALPIPAEEPAEKLPPSSSSSPGGVCLHVDRDHLSVEFCSLCAKRAASLETLPAASSSSSLLPPPAASSLLSKIFSFRCLPCQASLCRG